MGVAGLVAYGAGKAGAHLTGIGDVEQSGDVLRAFVIDSAAAIAVLQHSEGTAVIEGDFAYVEQHAIDEPAGKGKHPAACALQLFFCGLFAPQIENRANGQTGDQGDSGGRFPNISAEEGHVRGRSNVVPS